MVSCTGESSAFNKTHPLLQVESIHIQTSGLKKKKKLLKIWIFTPATFHCKPMKMLSHTHPPRSVLQNLCLSVRCYQALSQLQPQRHKSRLKSVHQTLPYGHQEKTTAGLRPALPSTEESISRGSPALQAGSESSPHHYPMSWLHPEGRLVLQHLLM